MNIEAFWSHKEVKANGCWEWTLSTRSGGYGQAHVSGKVVSCHRWAWLLTRGPIPDGMFVLHICDNPRCFNPAHLFIGNHHDNMQDKLKKGRRNGGGSIGERNASSKLIDSQVVEIRRLYSTGQYSERKLAKQFGIGKSAMHEIISGSHWKHIDA